MLHNCELKKQQQKKIQLHVLILKVEYQPP